MQQCKLITNLSCHKPELVVSFWLAFDSTSRLCADSIKSVNVSVSGKFCVVVDEGITDKPLSVEVFRALPEPFVLTSPWAVVQFVSNNVISEFENNFPLREDAKFFLLTTFDNMIVKYSLEEDGEKFDFNKDSIFTEDGEYVFWKELENGTYKQIAQANVVNMEQ